VSERAVSEPVRCAYFVCACRYSQGAATRLGSNRLVAV